MRDVLHLWTWDPDDSDINPEQLCGTQGLIRLVNNFKDLMQLQWSLYLKKNCQGHRHPWHGLQALHHARGH